MRAFELFTHCPRCGVVVEKPPANPFACAQCDLKLYFNPAVSVSAFLFDDRGRVLLIRRGKEPAKGKLATIGGFVDFAEDAETALHREVKEEVGGIITDVCYLSSAVNEYRYADVIYPVLDLFFTAKLINPESLIITAEAPEVLRFNISDVDESLLAFNSIKHAFASLGAKQKQ